MTRDNFLFFFILACFIFAPLNPLLAQNQDIVDLQRPLIIALDDNFPPYTFLNEDQSSSGLFVEVVSGALQHAGIPFKMIGRPWKRVIAMTDKAEVDASIPWRSKKERFEKYNMVGPITTHGSQTVFWARNDFPLTNWERLEDLADLRIGSISGYAYPKVFEEARFLKRMALTATNDQLITMLYNKRFDLMIGDQHVMATEARKQSLTGQFKQVGPALESVKRYVAVPKDKKQVAAIIEKALKDFQSTEDYRSILLGYQ